MRGTWLAVGVGVGLWAGAAGMRAQTAPLPTTIPTVTAQVPALRR